MKKNYLYTGVTAILLLASTMVGAEEKYPAANFKPTVVYQDSEYKPVKSTNTGSAKQKAEIDPDYPAANFQPKVLYKDDGYKPVKSNGLTNSSAKQGTAVSTSESGQDSSDSESDNSLFLVILVLAGLFYFFIKKGSITIGSKDNTAKRSRNADGQTGVSRYLQDNDGGSAVSGVAKYLEKQAHDSATGVAKYMAKQAENVKGTAGSSLSGVEKYLRDKN